MSAPIHYCNVGVDKQKGGSVGSASDHNDRDREVPNADPSRTHLNRVLVGDERNAREIVREIIDEHGGKPRRDSVEAVELLLSASPEWFLDGEGNIDQKKVDQFCEQSLKFLRDRSNCGICAKAVLHMDEHAPHIHAHMVPITEDGRLSAAHFLDGRKKMRGLHTKHASYMEPIGLRRGREGSPATHQRVRQFYGALNEEVKLEVDRDQVPDPPRWALLTEEGRERYKREVEQSILRQFLEKFGVVRDQAMRAKREHEKRVELERTWEERSAEVQREADGRVEAAERAAQEKIARAAQEAEERYSTLQGQARFIEAENRELRGENKSLLASRNEYWEKFVSEQLRAQHALVRASALSERLTDIPLLEVIQKMGYGKGEERGEGREKLNVYRSKEGGVVLIIKGQEAYDGCRELVCRNSVNLVQHVMKEHRGHEMTRDGAVTWLAQNFGRNRASAASLVEREQSVHGLFDRVLGRGEPGRGVPGHDRGGQDRDGTDRNGQNGGRRGGRSYRPGGR